MDLSEDLCGHRLGEANTSDLGAKCRSKLFDLDMVVLCFRRVRHAQYIFGRFGRSIPGIARTEHVAYWYRCSSSAFDVAERREEPFSRSSCTRALSWRQFDLQTPHPHGVCILGMHHVSHSPRGLYCNPRVLFAARSSHTPHSPRLLSQAFHPPIAVQSSHQHEAFNRGTNTGNASGMSGSLPTALLAERPTVEALFFLPWSRVTL
jgi:hypothetical protein